MRSWVSGTEDRPKVYRTFVRAFLFSQTTVLYPSLSISNRGAPIARIGRAEALPSLRIDADSVDQPHVLAQLGFTAKARRIVPAAFHVISTSAQSLLHAQGKLCFHADTVGKPLMMKARGVDSGLCAHAQAHPVDDAQQSGRNDRRPAGRAGDEAEFPIAQQNRRRHGTERAMSRSDGVGVRLHELIERIGSASLGGEVVHLVV